MSEILTVENRLARGSRGRPTKVREIVLPYPHPGQREVIDSTARFKVVDCGRRWGKTMGLAVHEGARTVLAGMPCGYFTPDYKRLTEYWEDMKHRLRPITVSKNEQLHVLRLMTGGILECWTLVDEFAGASRRYRLAILDEISMARNAGKIYRKAIRPTLADLVGDALFLSTPKGADFFYECYQRGQRRDLHPEWQSWKMPSQTNPYLRPEEIEAMRRDMTDLEYRQEVLAEFVMSGGEVFRKLDVACVLAAKSEPEKGHEYVWGIDWGQSINFTAVCCLDITPKYPEQVFAERWTNIPTEVQHEKLRAMMNVWKPKAVRAEENAMGMPLIERLQYEGYPVYGFRTTNASKAQAVHALALALDREVVKLLSDEDQLDELRSFRATELPGGGWRYSAPGELHDDMVDALWLSWQEADTIDWAEVVRPAAPKPDEQAERDFQDALRRLGVKGEEDFDD